MEGREREREKKKKKIARKTARGKESERPREADTPLGSAVVTGGRGGHGRGEGLLWHGARALTFIRPLTHTHTHTNAPIKAYYTREERERGE